MKKVWLVLTGMDTKIKKIFWCFPQDYLAEGDIFREKFESSFPDSKNIESIKERIYQISLGGNTIRYLAAGKELLILGYSHEFSISQNQMELIDNFLLHIKKNVLELDSIDSESPRYQFEEIQKLNNQLVNTQRQLEKANIKLNALNRELNNKLVKDALTGLVSRYQFRSEMKNIMDQSPGKMGIFTFIDIDDFKSVNDNYGHSAGDEYLMEFSERLRKISIMNSIHIRIAGDEFGIFSYGYEKVAYSEFTEIWEQILHKVLFGPIDIEGKKLDLSVSAGMAVLGKDTDEVFQIVEYADFAMYKAKKRGKNCYNTFDIEEFEKSKGIKE